MTSLFQGLCGKPLLRRLPARRHGARVCSEPSTGKPQRRHFSKKGNGLVLTRCSRRFVRIYHLYFVAPNRKTNSAKMLYLRGSRGENRRGQRRIWIKPNQTISYSEDFSPTVKSLALVGSIYSRSSSSWTVIINSPS